MDPTVLGAIIGSCSAAVGVAATVVSGLLAARSSRRQAQDAFDRQARVESERILWEARRSAYAGMLGLVNYRTAIFRDDLIRSWRGDSETEKILRETVLKLKPVEPTSALQSNFAVLASNAAQAALDRVHRSWDLLGQRRAERQSVLPGNPGETRVAEAQLSAAIAEFNAASDAIREVFRDEIASLSGLAVQASR